MFARNRRGHAASPARHGLVDVVVGEVRAVFVMAVAQQAVLAESADNIARIERVAPFADIAVRRRLKLSSMS